MYSGLETGLLDATWDLAKNAFRVRLEDAAENRARSPRHDRSQMLDSLSQDVKTALRSIRRRPLFSAIFIATLAIGVGANRTNYSLVHEGDEIVIDAARRVIDLAVDDAELATRRAAWRAPNRGTPRARWPSTRARLAAPTTGR